MRPKKNKQDEIIQILKYEYIHLDKIEAIAAAIAGLVVGIGATILIHIWW